jgi:hypothetical protein
MHVVAKVPDCFYRKVVVLNLGFLKADKIRCEGVYYGFKLVQAGADTVDVERDEHHFKILSGVDSRRSLPY